MMRLTPPKAVAVEWQVIKTPTAVLLLHLVALVAWASAWIARS